MERAKRSSQTEIVTPRSARQEAVDRVKGDLANFAQVRAWALLPRDFSPEEGEITPTLKQKRRVCEEHFADEIEQLYAS